MKTTMVDENYYAWWWNTIGRQIIEQGENNG
jgi:hypothetical protein